MSPEPNDQGNKNITENVDTNASEMAVNLAMALDDEQNGVSEGSDSETETGYAGYKLLQQDDVPNGCMDSSDDEAEEESTIPQFGTFQCMENALNVDINYQNLHCAAVDDFPSTSLGFPDLPAEDDPIQPTKDDKHKDMSDSQVELVKNAMAGFSLPAMNIPEWAKNLTEDDWLKTLSSTVQKKR